MSEPTESRALTSALSGPAFVTHGGRAAMHAANRHVERWAPEAGASRVGPLRNLGFVDRLVAPWIEASQRSPSLRMFSQYISGVGERAGNPVSWVFPRPWYQDELDWMAAARQVGAQSTQRPQQAAPSMLTTRGTYVAPTQHRAELPSALYEFVAPSLSVARPDGSASEAHAGHAQPYSPLVPLAAAQGAQMMSRMMTPIMSAAPSASTRMTAGLRDVLQRMLERTAQAAQATDQRWQPPQATRLAQHAPELVTPPAPRADAIEAIVGDNRATQVAQHYSEQHTRIAELQRVARAAVERELQTRVERQTGADSRAVAELRGAQPRGDVQQRAADQQRAEVQADQQRAEVQADLQQRADAQRTDAQQRASELVARREAERAADATSVAAERQRLEERIAQRIADRGAVGSATEGRRGSIERGLHEHAREAAARDAVRAAAAGAASEAAARPDAPRAESSNLTQQAIAAAVAALPPELSAMVASGIAQHPDRAMQTINELGEALRAVELLARNAAVGGTFEATRGPRLVMPAGLGGLVATVERATAIAPMPMSIGAAGAALAIGDAPGPGQPRTATGVPVRVRVPAMSWLSTQSRSPIGASNMPVATTALGATANASPAALHHVAWADRWLARFAGARPQSLDVLSASTSTAEARMQALAAAAPDAVFVAPTMEGAAPVEHPAAMPQGDDRPAPRIQPARGQHPVMRFDDSAETPDDVFAAISAAAAHARSTPTPVTTAGAAVSSPVASASPVWERETMADLVAHRVPSAPGAGLSAQLASSPFAPALRHVLPLGAAASFDVRALFGGLGATYLAGLLSPATHEFSLGAQPRPTWLDPGTRLGSTHETTHDVDDRDLRPGSASRGSIENWDPTYVAPEQPTLEPAIADPEAALAPLTTLRSALLSWSVELAQLPDQAATRVAEASSSSAFASTGSPFAMAGNPLAGATAGSPFASTMAPNGPLARSMIEAMTMPMLGELAAIHQDHEVTAFAAPGMIADRAQAWSVAQERSSSDLALDFVMPELVLAARVYGLGPTEAAQAGRLAIAGPGQLGAMASTVDRTFVQAMAIDAARRGEAVSSRLGEPPRDHDRERSITGEPGGRWITGDAAGRAITGDAAGRAITGDAAGRAITGDAAGRPITAFPATAPTSFGVARKTPRGAFLWPSATIAALGLHAAAPDGEHSMSVAALELLAAQAVAELGTYAALVEPRVAGHRAEGESPAGGAISPAATPTASSATTMSSPNQHAAAPATSSPTSIAPVAADELGEAEVLDSASAFVTTSRRAKFQVLYLALGQSSVGRGWSPAARAARALALAGRGDDTISARERASIAWEVLPAVYAGVFDEAPRSSATGQSQSIESIGAARSIGAAQSSTTAGLAPGSARRRGFEPPDAVVVESRPGLGALSARAGEALGSYVTPPPEPAPASRTEQDAQAAQGAVMRAPTAAQELVRPGRPSGRHGGGETEIPPWFEAAARKMLEERSGASDGISLAELTLVNAAPAAHVAAAGRGAPSAAPAMPGTGAQQPAGQKLDVEKIANDVYKQILVLMDAARARNGEPYL